MPSSAHYRESAQRFHGAAAKVKLAIGACEPIPLAAFNVGPAASRVRREMDLGRDELQRMFAQLCSLADLMESRLAGALAYEDQVESYTIAMAAHAQRVAFHEATRTLPGRASVDPGPAPLRPIPPSFVVND